MVAPPIVVLKFGSSVLRREEDLPAAVHEIYRYVRHGYGVVAVVSALYRTTDQLLELAHRLAPEPEPQALASLLATGEATSAALVALALDRAGIPATLVEPQRLGLSTRGSLLDGDPVDLNRRVLLQALKARPVVVVGGFVGLGPDGGTSLLGRGGSDLTALFLAQRLGARAKGLAEADSAADLDGTDAALKLRILAREALGVDLPLAHIRRHGQGAIEEAAAQFSSQESRTLRQVASCHRTPRGLVARVALVNLPATHFLAGARREENRVILRAQGEGPLYLAGKGAGRWPTAEAVMTDVLDLYRLRRLSQRTLETGRGRRARG